MQGYNRYGYPMGPGYGPPPMGYNTGVPVQTQPNTVIIQEKKGASTGEAAAAGCCGACLACLCCCCLAAAAGSGGGHLRHGRRRW